MTGRYLTIFTGVLVQESSLSAGGTRTGAAVDDPFCRDGRGRFTLSGAGLAGALVATARRLYREIPACIASTPGPRRGAKDPDESVWRVFTTHPMDARGAESRQGVGIRHDTGAAAEGVLYDLEVLPRGTRWRFALEVDTRRGGVEVEALAAEALREWARGRCWIGRSVARGTGWMRLDELRAWRLDTHRIDDWPDSRAESLEAVLERLRAEGLVAPMVMEEFEEAFQGRRPDRSWCYAEIRGTIQVGEADEGYGIDALSVSGHAANEAFVTWDEHYLASRGREKEHEKRAFAPDASIVMTNSDGRKEPFIPGSGLRGPLRHALSRWYRERGERVRDPNLGRSLPEGTHAVDRLFGTVEQSAALLVCDAWLEDGAWTAAWLQHHAEDEFAGGVYEASKFDRVALVKARFQWRMVIEAATRREVEGYVKMLEPVLRMGAEGHLPVGGAQWRGVGWVRWSVDSTQYLHTGPEDGALEDETPTEEKEPESASVPTQERAGAEARRRRRSRVQVMQERATARAQGVTEVTVSVRHGVSPSGVREFLRSRREEMAARSMVPVISWVEPGPTLAPPGSDGGIPVGEVECLHEGWPDERIEPDEARVSWATGMLHVVTAERGCRWVEIEERADRDVTLGWSDKRVTRVESTLLLRRDWKRFGKARPEEIARVVEYREGARLVAWRVLPAEGG